MARRIKQDDKAQPDSSRVVVRHNPHSELHCASAYFVNQDQGACLSLRIAPLFLCRLSNGPIRNPGMQP